MKNLLVLGFLTLVTAAYAQGPIKKESLDNAESFRVEKAVKEKSPGRAFAGAKAKKETEEVNSKDDMPTTEDSEVRFWRYQE